MSKVILQELFVWCLAAAAVVVVVAAVAVGGGENE